MLSILNNSQSKVAQVSCTGFWIKQQNCMLPLCHRIRSRLIFPYRKLFLTVHWSVRVITNWSVNCQEQFSRNHGRISWTEQTWSRIALPNFTKTVNLNLEKPHFQKHNRKTNPERNRMFAAERYTGTSRKQILWKINSALYSKQLGEHSCSSVLHWILDEATEMHATIISQNSIQVDFPVQEIVLDSSLISSWS